MRKILFMCMCTVLLLSFAACNRKDGNRETTACGVVFEAVVKEITEESILVMPFDGYDEAGVALDIGLLVMKSDKIPAVQVGDRVRIDYDGVITRSIPGQLGQVFRFEVIE